jgi:cyclic-di-GMP phosphodiesterase, flagellum assembly factor TipF
MVALARKRTFFRGKEAALFALCLVSAAAATAIAIEASAGVTILAVLHVMALFGIAIAWLRADAAWKAAEKASADIILVAHRLIRLEQQSRVPGGANPVLRSTMAEVTGTVGLLGGVVRELARNVAAQHRDVAELKDSLTGSVKVEDGTSGREPLPERDLANQPDPGVPVAQPEPSLLPVRRPATEDEIQRMGLVTQAFEANWIELHLQPVVALPRRKVRFYEALARLRLVDGTLLGPAEFLPVLERLGRAPEFDRRVMKRAITVARHLIARGSEAIIGVNLSPRSIREPGFLHSLARLMDGSPEIVGKIVLEFPQGAWRSLDPEQKEALAVLRDKGVPMSLDRAVDLAFDSRALADLAFDSRALADLGIRFLKLPAEMMIAAAGQDGIEMVGQDPGVREFATLLRREGIKLVAERVEREDMVPLLAEMGVPLAQGFVFAAPRAVRAELQDASAQTKAPASEGVKPSLRHAG